MGAKDGLMEAEEECDAANVVGCDGEIKPPEIPVQTLKEKAKFYTSLCLGTTAIISAFAFLFLIPFVVTPGFNTIVADYQQEPVTCRGVSHVYSEGMRNCSWASCKEGCTAPLLKCHQITVEYSKTLYEEFQQHKNPEKLIWEVNTTRLLINTEGCGYPPKVNCSEFALQYGYRNLRKTFPCYYSRTYPEKVVARFNWNENLWHLIVSLVVPTSLFGVSLGVLIFWYCPGLQRNCAKRLVKGKYPSKEDLNPNFDEDY